MANSGVVLIVTGFGLFLIGVIILLCYPGIRKKNTRCSAAAQGILADVRTRFNSKGRLPDLHVYSYWVDGIEYRLNSTSYNKEANAVGDPCTIWYNPKKPEEAQEFHYETAKSLRYVLFIGIGMIALSFTLTFFGFLQLIR